MSDEEVDDLRAIRLQLSENKAEREIFHTMIMEEFGTLKKEVGDVNKTVLEHNKSISEYLTAKTQVSAVWNFLKWFGRFILTVGGAIGAAYLFLKHEFFGL